jgi:hypothetical protein
MGNPSMQGFHMSQPRTTTSLRSFLSALGRNPGLIVLTVLLVLLAPALAADIASSPNHSLAGKLQTIERADPASNKVALVIGNSAYREVASLPNVANDLEDMCMVLRGLGFRATCLADLSTREAFVDAVKAHVGQVPAGASAVLHYSGHAIQVSGENYLIPTGATGTDARGWMAQFVRLSEVFQIAEQARVGFQLIVLDACRDDPDAETTSAARASDSAGRGGQVQAASAAGRQNLRAMLASVRSTGRLASYGVAAVRDAPSNTLVLFATGAGTQAFDGDGERNGPLTKHLLVQMQRPSLNIDDAVKAIILGVGDDTERRYGRRQSPSLYGTFAGQFCFNGCPVIVTPEQVEAERQRAAQGERERAALQERQRQLEAQRRRRSTAVVPSM